MSSKEEIVKAFKLAEQKTSYILETINLNEKLEVESSVIFRTSFSNHQMEMRNSKGQKVFEIIIVNETRYNWLIEWSKFERTVEDDFDCIKEYAKSSEFIKNAEFVGREKILDENAYLYQYDFDLNVLNDKTLLPFSEKFPDNKIKIWIGSEGLPIKIEYEGQLNYIKDVKFSKVIETFVFDENVNIEAPKI